MPSPTPAPDGDPPRRGARIPPVVLGMLLDAVDLVTLGPVGLYGGFVVGGLVAGWAAREVGLEGRMVWVAALAGAVYTATPATELVPFGTVVGLLIQARRS